MSKKPVLKTSNTGNIKTTTQYPDFSIKSAPTTNIVGSEIKISEFDQSMDEYTNITDENLFNKRRLERLRLQFTEKLLAYIVDEDFEYGIRTKADILVEEQLNINALATKAWLNAIFVKYFFDANILIGLLRLIARVDYSVIHPEGLTIATAALSHKNTEVQECGARAFESWGTLNSLSILENLNIQIPWLKSYIDDVISDLRKEHNVAVS